MNASKDLLIHIEGLTKYYNGLLALENLNLDIYQGEIFGYLGPNGAGKTTTIRMLLDLIRPSSGKATIFGLDAQRDSVEIHTQIGNLPGELSLYERMTGWELIHFLGDLRGGVDEVYVKDLAERLDMDMTRRVKTCSSGMKRKLGLIQALMHKPKLLILDEPTLGLDPLVQQTFFHLMREATRNGTTVFMSSHNLPEVETICDRVGILRKGKLESVQNILDLKKVRFRYMTLYVDEAIDTAKFESLEGVSEVEQQDGFVRMRVAGELDQVIKTAAQYHVIDLHYHEPNLEEVFLEYYGEEENHV
jgi:ABC-2 type transport system ATP-binding protein